MDPVYREQVEAWLRQRFRSWLGGLDAEQLTALRENWQNVLDDAALDRVDSWVIAAKTLAKLRSEGPAAT